MTKSPAPLPDVEEMATLIAAIDGAPTLEQWAAIDRVPTMLRTLASQVAWLEASERKAREELATALLDRLQDGNRASGGEIERACEAWHNADLDSSRSWTPWADCLPHYKDHVRTCISAAIAALKATPKPDDAWQEAQFKTTLGHMPVGAATPQPDDAQRADILVEEWANNCGSVRIEPRFMCDLARDIANSYAEIRAQEREACAKFLDNGGFRLIAAAIREGKHHG